MVKQVPFRLPRPVDADNVSSMMEKSIEDEYRRERMRRKRLEDDYRDTVRGNLPAGEFSYSNISIRDDWKDMYFNKYGGQALPITQNYRCRHCGMEFGLAFPPQICPRCHKDTAFGELVKDGSFKR